MAWMPTQFLLRGLLDNRTAGRVTGWLRFAGIPLLVIVDLDGDFDPDIRGQRVALVGPGSPRDGRAARCMAAFGLRQLGSVIKMTAGRSPASGQPIFAWDSDQSGRVSLELQPWQLRVVGDTSLLPVRALLVNLRHVMAAPGQADGD